MRTTLATTFAILFSLQAAAQTPSLIAESVKKRAAERVAQRAYPSLVIAVVDGDRQEIVTFGSLSDDKVRQPDADTVYEIGSVTKTFTALLLADAVARGEVTLDEPVQRLLPDYKIPKDGEHAITLLDLATQSSGLPRLPSNFFPKDIANPYADYGNDNLKSFFAQYTLPRNPGERYEYSNLGFGVLGQALAARAKSSYGELVRSRITAPLGMNDTAIVLTPRMKERFATGHDATGKVAKPWDLGAFEGAGALRSTAHDMLTYLRALMHPSAGPLSKAASLVAQPRRPTEMDGVKIALAWHVESRQGEEIVWHNGMTGGYASFVAFTADRKRGVVVLTNVSRDAGEIGFSALLPEAPMPKEISLATDALSDYVGRYRLAPEVELSMRVADGALLARVTGQPEIPIFASAKDEFFYKAVDAQLSFHRDTQGKVDSVTLHQNGRNMPAPRVANEPAPPPKERKEIKLEPAALRAYTGRYLLAPTFVLEVTVEGDQLYVQATAQPRFPVFAFAPDEFFYKVVDAQLTFTRGADGSVQSVTLHQGGRDINGPKEAKAQN